MCNLSGTCSRYHKLNASFFIVFLFLGIGNCDLKNYYYKIEPHVMWLLKKQGKSHLINDLEVKIVRKVGEIWCQLQVDFEYNNMIVIHYMIQLTNNVVIYKAHHDSYLRLLEI